MDRRSFIKSMAAAAFLPFLPKGLPPEKEKHEVWLQRSRIAGFQYYEGEVFRHSLKAGEPLTLRREPDNPHDSLAVEVLWHNHKLGYIPRYENSMLASLMDQKALLSARITHVGESDNGWQRVDIDVYLMVDEAS